MARHALAGLAPLLVGTLAAVPASADMITVNAAGGADYTTIGEALAAAVDGDWITVAAGTYTGPNNRELDFGGKRIVVQAETPTDRPVIDCEQQGRAFYFHSGETGESVVAYLHIANAYCAGTGGAILIDGASPTIWRCTFTNNTATASGGAIHIDGSPVGVDVGECTFISNAAGENGGAICIANSTEETYVSHCTFTGNTAGLRGGAVMCDHADADLDRCVFDENTVATLIASRDYGGGGLHVHGGAVLLSCGTFVRNAAFMGASAVHSSSGTVQVQRCILAFGLGGPAAAGLLTVQTSDVFGNAGGDSLDCNHYDNMFVDPLFCDVANGDYTLCANSPCPGESPQNPWGDSLGALGVGCGDCGSAVQAATWGAIKGLYR